MSVLLHITSDMCALDSRNVLHAAKARRPGKRKTYDTACGKRARLLAFPLQNRPADVMTVRWPVYVAQAREWGYERCRDCMDAAPGRPERVVFAGGGS